jgi:acetyltransferase-like isoleucine patch superfamily enzyme
MRSLKRGYHAGMPFATTLFADTKGALITIGDNCRINGAYIHAQKKIEIGSNCVIASGVNIIDSNGHQLLSNNRTRGRDDAKEIIIGNNVWIGLNSIILKGTIMGDNCVVSAGSVVKGIFDANSLIQGNPAVKVNTLEIN